MTGTTARHGDAAEVRLAGASGTSRYFGAYPAIVTDIVDPEDLGRIRVRFPWLGAESDRTQAWATLLSSYADDDQGFFALPAVDTQVVVLFEAGELRRPYIVGAAWNGREAMPERPAAPNNLRLIKTRSGSILEFDDSPGATKVTLETAGGHRVVLDEGAQNITIAHLNGCTITFAASGAINVNANSMVDVTAPLLNVHAATAVFDGIITCTSLVASAAVSSPLYTPGAGNIW